MKHQSFRNIGFAILLVALTACGGDSSPPGPVPPAQGSTTPATPVWATLVPGDAQVSLNWQANTEPNLAAYKLYWGSSAADLYQTADLEKGKTSHLVSGLTNGNLYYFALAAADTSGNLSARSEIATTMPESLAVPPPPLPPAAGDFSISTQPSISIQKGQGKNLLVIIARNAFPDQVSLTLKSAPVGVSSDLPKVTSGDQISLTLSVAGSVAAGDHPLTLEATGKGLTKTANLTLKVTEAPVIPVAKPEIDSVSLEGFAGKQVRQGYGNLILKVSGKHLGNIAQAKLETSNDGFIITLAASILSQTDTSATLQTTVQHGAKTGSYRLVLGNGASAHKDGVMMITYIIASPTGNNATGKGTLESPFRSLTKAVSVAENTDVVFLTPGEYNLLSGEVFPINVSGKKIGTISGVNAVINGAGSNENCLGVVNGAAETLLYDLSLTNCGAGGIMLGGGKTTLNRIQVSNSQDGLRVRGNAEVKISGSVFRDNDQEGIVAYDYGKLSFEGDNGTRILDNGGRGLLAFDLVQVSGKKLTVSGNTPAGIQVQGLVTITLEQSTLSENKGSGVFLTGNNKIELTDSEIARNTTDGILVNVQNTHIAHLELAGVRILDNGQSGIEYRSESAASRLTMRDSLIADNTTYGLYIAGQPATVLLGLVSGNNHFRNNGSTHLADARLAGSGAIPARGTRFTNGAATTLPSGIKNGPTSQLPNWQIVNAGNSINFGSP